jgi:uncharacterized protein (TIGR03435 family)
MPRLRVLSRNSIKRLTSVTTAAAISAIFLCGILYPALGRAQSQIPSTTPALPEYKYDVASIKPSKLMNMRWNDSPDGLTVTAVTLNVLVQSAFHVTGDYGLSGGPPWLNSDRYDVEAKMDPEAAEAVSKLSKEDRAMVQQHMLQALLAERFGLVFHRENREMQVYTLVIAKNGSKLHEAKPGDTYPNGIKLATGPGGAGVMMMRGGPGGSFTITAQGVPLSSFIPQLSFNSGRPILDKTSLTGIYDFTLTYSLDQNASASAPTGMPPPPTDAGAPSIFTAVQDQLGLKLESGKGPVEVIVIDHAEKPSGN